LEEARLAIDQEPQMFTSGTRLAVPIPMLKAAPFALLTVLFAACASTQGDQQLVLSNSIDGKSDSADGKTIDTVVTAEERIDVPTTYNGTFSVPAADDSWLEIQGKRLLFRPGVDRSFSVSVDRGYSDYLTDLRFLFVYRLADSGSDWQMMSFDGTSSSIFGGSQPIKLNNFSAITVDPVGETATLTIDSHELTTDIGGLGGVEVEYAVFVFPYSGWGSLKGDYDYILTLATK
jgi:hypothetical protein